MRAKGGCALALPAARQLILTSTWIEMCGCCQFSKRINFCGLLHEVNIPCLFLWLLSLFRFYFPHVMPSAVFFLNWCCIHRKENMLCAKKTGDNVWSQVSTFYTLYHFLARTEKQSQYQKCGLIFFLILYLKKTKFKKFLAKRIGIWANKIGGDHFICI